MPTETGDKDFFRSVQESFAALGNDLRRMYAEVEGLSKKVFVLEAKTTSLSEGLDAIEADATESFGEVSKDLQNFSEELLRLQKAFAVLEPVKAVEPVQRGRKLYERVTEVPQDFLTAQKSKKKVSEVIAEEDELRKEVTKFEREKDKKRGLPKKS